MTYKEFLAGCRKLAAKSKGKEDLSRKEFAEACSTDEKTYTEAYFRNIEEGYQPPGRELLENAARAAGFDFEDSLRLPLKIEEAAAKRIAIRSFMKAIGDWREPHAIEAAAVLSEMKKPRRPKSGGRTRKKPE